MARPVTHIAGAGPAGEEIRLERTATAAATPTVVGMNNFRDVVLRSPLPVLVEFGASWCAPCRELAPMMRALAAELSDRAVIATVDVDAEPALATAGRIGTIPTILIFKNGHITEAFLGLHPKETFVAELLA